MKNLHKNHFLLPVMAALYVLLATTFARAQEHASFDSAQDAAAALIAALETNDLAMLGRLLGPDTEDVFSSGDDVADANARANFLALYRAEHDLVADGEDTMVLQVGPEDWPLPTPFTEIDGKWYVDGAAGADEIIYRRIGRNELGAIAVCRGFVDAQIDYAAEGHDGNDPGIFAAKLRSDPGQHNGLYWQADEGEPESPIGEAVARAAAEGYRAVAGKRKPYHGYYYRMLYAQGANANGGAMEYFQDGVLSGGVALLAWPANYEASGVKSFMVNQEGVVYEKDLGEDTGTVVEGIQVFDPDDSWSVVETEDES
ncbi:MAG: DUF2950 domain-containing protein [Halieaceae bacterium]|jgi:hypothetical protein|nr:DUF2950 domain-containing protein [Halieaceae bacterium]